MSAVRAWIGRSRKAIGGALSAAIPAAIPLVDDGLVPSEVLTILGAALAGGGLVYVLRNVDPEPDTDDDATEGSVETS